MMRRGGRREKEGNESKRNTIAEDIKEVSAHLEGEIDGDRGQGR